MATQVGAVVAAMRARREREIVGVLTAMDALDAGSAVPFTPADRMARQVLARLERRGAVHVAGNGRYWIDPAAYRAMVARRRRTALWIIGAALVVLLAVLVFTWGR